MLISIITPTHNSKWLSDTWKSIKDQETNWEWIIFCNGPDADTHARIARDLVQEHPSVHVYSQMITGGIGAVKAAAFRKAHGDLLLELDHDDLLTDNALQVLTEAAQSNPDCGFFYSASANFSDSEGPLLQGTDHTYMAPGARASWEANGWRFKKTSVQSRARPGQYWYPESFDASAASLHSLLWSPNHLRAWRSVTYAALGGHNALYSIADDHELLIRTFLTTKMHSIREVLYLYRCSGENSWAARAGEVAEISGKLGAEYLEAMILREAALHKLPAYDLGCGKHPRAGWTGVDKNPDNAPQVQADLMQPWPFADSSVFAFRASDLIEHLPNKQFTMSEIHRCLVPGGWLLSLTPSTDGRGAFQDPTHVSFWNENSFWYYTRAVQAAYINSEVKFAASSLYTHFPNLWHKEHNIAYVTAHLIALKPGYLGPIPQSA